MLTSLNIRAVNTALDSENRIHEDSIAAEYGFRGGLVPGVTVYGYMASAAIDRLGLDWLTRGAMDVRFFMPFFDGEAVEMTVVPAENDRVKIDASTRATATAWIDGSRLTENDPIAAPLGDRVAASRETIRPGVVLGAIEKTLDLSEPQVSAPLDAFIGSERLAHPAILLSLANEILMRNVVLGPWIHSSSEVRNFTPARDGETLHVLAKIEDAYEKKGHEFAVLDVAIMCGDRLVCRVRHTVIWQLRRPS